MSRSDRVSLRYIRDIGRRLRATERNKVSNLLALLFISGVAVHLEYPDIQDGRRLADEENPSESQTPNLLPRA